MNSAGSGQENIITLPDKALRRLALACLRYAPLVASDPPAGLWLDITGCAHLFGGEEAVCADLLARLARRGFAARLAIADTPGAAHALARYGEHQDLWGDQAAAG